jgi:glycosyltransferase involved in cell wall biosynthesis
MVLAGGLERMSFEVLRALRGQGAATHVIVNGWKSSPIVALAESVGATWSTGDYRQPFSRDLFAAAGARMVIDMLRTSAGLLRDARRLHPTHVLLPDFGAALRNLPALWWLRARGTTIVMRLGNAPTVDGLHRRMWRLIDTAVDCYVPNSQYIAGELRRHAIDAGKIRVVLNTVSSRNVEPTGPAPFDPNRIVYVGQLIPPKGVHVLLDAMAELRRSGMKATLQIVGATDGWESPSYAGYREALRRRAAEPDLERCVTFAGYDDNVMRRLAQAAVHCCPSQPEQREGLAGVVLEAKSAGVPSVVTPTGSLPELVRHRVDGWISRDASAPALAEGLAYFLQHDGARREAALAARQSMTRFSHERFVAEWCRVFDIEPNTDADAGAERWAS